MILVIFIRASLKQRSNSTITKQARKTVVVKTVGEESKTQNKKVELQDTINTKQRHETARRKRPKKKVVKGQYKQRTLAGF